MDILTYIQRMNQLYGSEQQVAGLPYRYGTQDTYSAPEELSPAPNWRDLIREEGVQVGEQVKDGGRIGFTPGGSADLEKEYYGSQKLDWMKNFPDLSIIFVSHRDLMITQRHKLFNLQNKKIYEKNTK